MSAAAVKRKACNGDNNGRRDDDGDDGVKVVGI